MKHEFLSRGEVPVRPNLFDLDFARSRVVFDPDEWIDVRLLPHTAQIVRLDCSRLASPLPEILRETDEVVLPTCR